MTHTFRDHLTDVVENETMTADELEELASAKAAQAPLQSYVADVLKDLREGEVYWIPGPFANKFWPDRKPVKPKHACPDCGAKHVIR